MRNIERFFFFIILITIYQVQEVQIAQASDRPWQQTSQLKKQKPKGQQLQPQNTLNLTNTAKQTELAHETYTSPKGVIYRKKIVIRSCQEPTRVDHIEKHFLDDGDGENYTYFDPNSPACSDVVSFIDKIFEQLSNILDNTTQNNQKLPNTTIPINGYDYSVQSEYNNIADLHVLDIKQQQGIDINNYPTTGFTGREHKNGSRIVLKGYRITFKRIQDGRPCMVSFFPI